jgi:DNA-binding transcriptional ArsR family regulator
VAAKKSRATSGAGGKGSRGKAAKAKGAGKKARRLVDPRFATALGHPLRVHILGVIAQRKLSPVEVARECDLSTSEVAYHFKVLRECDAIELVEEVPRRGAVEHIHRGTERALFDDTEWKRMPKSIQGGATAVTLGDLSENMLGALEAGTFDAREDRILIWSLGRLDETAWRRLVEFGKEAWEEVTEIEADAATRLAESGEEGFQVGFVISAYEAPEQRRRR